MGFGRLFKKFVGLYTGANAGVATIATVTGIVAVAVTGVVIVKVVTDNDQKTINTSAPVITETTTEFLTEETTEEVTTEEPTTEEVTTEEPTTEEPTTVPETIPIEELNIVSNDEAEEFDAKAQAQQEAFEPETQAPTEPATQAPAVIEKPTETPKVSEVAAIVKGIDVSKWQGNIDWSKVKNDGVQFAIIKAAGRSIGSSGGLYEDVLFKQNIEGALSNGIPVGVYFFSQALSVQEAREEASYILSLIKDYKITYPVVFDWETTSGYRTYNAGLSKDQMDAIASTFCDMVSSAGYTPMIYGNTWDMNNRYNTEKICNKYKVWIAKYVSSYKNNGVEYKKGDPLPNDFNYSYQMWQYGSTGRVDGISGNVDMNVGFFSFNGSEVPQTALQFKVTNTTVTTNVGTVPDLMSGVSAFNTAGLDATSKVVLTIKNSAGSEVNKDVACNAPGKYTLSYYYKDFTGASKTITATLIVRGKPTLTLNSPVFNYTYEEAVNIKDTLSDIITGNIKESYDYEKNNLKDKISIKYDELLKAVSGESVIPGTYEITYQVTDSKNLTSSVTATFTIAEPETTTSVEDESTSDGETTVDETTNGGESLTSGETTTSNEETSVISKTTTNAN